MAEHRVPAALRAAVATSTPSSNGSGKGAPVKQLRIVKPGERTRDSMCFYGISGIGKTSLLRTMQGRGLIFDIVIAEAGTQPLEDQADRLTVIEIDDWGDLALGMDYAIEHVHDFDWVAWDTITGINELAIRHTKRETLKIDPLNDAYDISLKEWGKVGQLDHEFVVQTKRIPLPKIFLAQERRFEDHNEGRKARGELLPTIVGPDMTPGALASLRPTMLVIGRLFPIYQGKKIIRRMQVAPDENTTAKFTTTFKAASSVPPVLIRPNLSDIWAVAHGNTEITLRGVDEQTERASRGITRQ